MSNNNESGNKPVIKTGDTLANHVKNNPKAAKKKEQWPPVPKNLP